MSLDHREYRVFVFRHERPGKRPMWCAYTVWANESWDGCRVVRVRAASGAEAKRIAIAQEKAKERQP